MTPRPRTVVCADFGSTFTKTLLVDLDAGELVATAVHRTTIETDVLDGLDACVRELEAQGVPVLACSSAGGGLRIAVAGNEALVTSEAGRRVALSSGGKVVHVGSGGLAGPSYDALVASAPDVLLLVGGTDGGNSEVLLADAALLAERGWTAPVVVAGDATVRERVAALLEASGIPHVLADNVVPRIGVLAPESARQAIRAMFVEHVIGGKGLSRRADFPTMVRGATPDLVLSGVEVLAGLTGEDGVVVVDVGGATTDVHSVVPVDPEDADLAREVVAPTAAGRTVEGDLGLRWSAESTVAAGLEQGLARLPGGLLRRAAARRAADPSYLPDGAEEGAADVEIARLAATIAVRRHAGRSRVVIGPDGRAVERTGRDLREVALLVGSGGVLRHHPDEVASEVLGAVVGVSPEGYQQPERARVLVDRDYLLAAVGLLAQESAEVARALAARLLPDDWS